jgi:hypothetical protein
LVDPDGISVSQMTMDMFNLLSTIFQLYRGGQFYVTILLDSNKYIHMLQNDRIQRTTYYIMRWSSPGINQ